MRRERERDRQRAEEFKFQKCPIKIPDLIYFPNWASRLSISIIIIIIGLKMIGSTEYVCSARTYGREPPWGRSTEGTNRYMEKRKKYRSE